METLKDKLAIYRPDLDDGNDSQFADVRAALEGDPELAAWFQNEKAFDDAFSRKLAEIRPPADLKARILDGASSDTTRPNAAPAQNVVHLTWWQSPATWGMAACILLVGIIGILLTEEDDPEPIATPIAYAGGRGLEQLISAVIDHNSKRQNLEMHSEDFAEISRFLTEANAPVPVDLPQKISSMSRVGCMSFGYGDSRVSLLCLKGDKVYHLYIADRKSVKCNEVIEKPEIRLVNDTPAATWTDNEKVYILTVDGKADDLVTLL